MLLPLGAWFAASSRAGFEGKTLSNLSLEPLLVILLSLAVFWGWFLTARKGLKPAAGIFLLIILLAAALAVHRLVPPLNE